MEIWYLLLMLCLTTFFEVAPISEETNLDDVALMRLHRAFTDPILVHEPTREYTPPCTQQIYDDIRLDRLQRYRNAPVTKRVDKVGWSETTLYLSTASFDERYANPRFRDAYKYAFITYLEDWHPDTRETLSSPLSDPPHLTAYWRERLEDLRYGMKADLDKYWVDHHYDDFDPDFPKQFLLSEHDLRRDPDHRDEYARSALEEFRNQEPD